MLMTAREYNEIRAFDDAFGLRELRAKVAGKINIGPSRFSINREFCYGVKSVEIVRYYLESGALARLYERQFGRDRCWSGADGHNYVTLLACCVTLGVDLDILGSEEQRSKVVHPSYLQHVKKVAPMYQRSALAMQQLRTALAQHENGVSYDFGNKTFLEDCTASMFGSKAKTSLTDLGYAKLVEIKIGSKTIPQIIGPPCDEEEGYENARIYPANVCANCGSSSAASGEGQPLMMCARCHDRSYCSKECQKKHWKLHKIICTIPQHEMATFMLLLPAGIDDADSKAKDAIATALGDNELVFGGGLSASKAFGEMSKAETKGTSGM